MLPNLIQSLLETRRLSADQSRALTNDENLRREVASYFVQNKNHSLARLLLDSCRTVASKTSDWDDDSGYDMNSATIMLAAWIVGLHGDVSDCLKVWDAKRVNFDYFCGVDIQLIAFAGLEDTITFLKAYPSREAQDALKYVLECAEAGDFEQMQIWFPEHGLPYFV